MLQLWLDEFLDAECTNEVFEVQEQFAFGISAELTRLRTAEKVLLHRATCIVLCLQKVLCLWICCRSHTCLLNMAASCPFPGLSDPTVTCECTI